MKKRIFTDEHKAWLTVHWPRLDIASLTEAFNNEFSTELSCAQVLAAVRRYKIKNGRKKGELNRGAKRKYTDEMLEFMRLNYQKAPIKSWIDEFNLKFSTSISNDAICGTCKRLGIKSGRTGQFEKGRAAANKGKPHPPRGKTVETMFGGIRSNSNALKTKRPIGSTRVCKKDGYLLIKTSDASPRWRHAHVMLWEQAHGKIPENHIVRFYDRSADKLKNPTLDNLFLVSRALHAVLNKMNFKEIPNDAKETAILITKLKQKIKEKTKK